METAKLNTLIYDEIGFCLSNHGNLLSSFVGKWDCYGAAGTFPEQSIGEVG